MLSAHWDSGGEMIINQQFRLSILNQVQSREIIDLVASVRLYLYPSILV